MSTKNEPWLDQAITKYSRLKDVLYSADSTALKNPIITEDALRPLLDGQYYKRLNPEGKRLVQDTLQSTANYALDLLLQSPAQPAAPYLGLADVLVSRHTDLNVEKGNAGIIKLAKKLHDALDENAETLPPETRTKIVEQTEAWYRRSLKDKGAGSDATKLGLGIFLYEYRAHENTGVRQEAIGLMGDVAGKGNPAAISTLTTLIVQGGLRKDEVNVGVDYVLKGARKSPSASADAITQLENGGYIVAIDTAEPTKPNGRPKAAPVPVPAQS